VLLPIIVIVAVVAASLWAATTAADSATRLTAAQDDAANLILQQAKYSEGQRVADQVKAVTDAEAIATAAELDISGLIVAAIGATPPSVAIISYEWQQATPVVDNDTPKGPLQGPRVGSLRITGLTANFADTDPWVKSLGKLKGFAGSTVLKVEEGYAVSVTIYVSDQLLLNRFPFSTGTAGAGGSASGNGSSTSTPSPTNTPTPTATPSGSEG